MLILKPVLVLTANGWQPNGMWWVARILADGRRWTPVSIHPDEASARASIAA